jgi:uncharacterized protein (TIGR00290 family)
MTSLVAVLLAWSGGKDSTLALAHLRQQPGYSVVGLLTTVTSAYDRISIHGVRRSILRAQAKSLGLPVFEAVLAGNAGNAEYEAAWASAVAESMSTVGEVSTIAYGDLFLQDVREFREAQSRRLGYTTLFPLWGRGTRALAQEFVDAGYEAYVTCVDTTQLSPKFAGRQFDESLLADLPSSVDPCGERGEFHTCVVSGPVFSEAIPVSIGERVRRDGRFEYCDLVPVLAVGR